MLVRPVAASTWQSASGAARETPRGRSAYPVLAMRKLLDPPPSVLSASTGAPMDGSFRGPLPRVDLSSVDGALFRLAHHKKWTYVGIATDEVYVAVAIVDLGYVANAFAFAFEKGSGMLFDRSSLGPPFAVQLGDDAEEGVLGRFELGATRFRVERPAGASAYDVDLRAPGFELRARLDTAGAPPPISAIARLPGRCLNATQKRALLPVTGTATINGRTHRLDGGLAGIDYTHGLLARHTAWRWAFALGRAASGEKVGLNLVEGFVGEAECAVWVDGDLIPVGEGRFDFDPKRPLDPWRVRTADGGVELRFEPGGIHQEHKNLVVAKSHFLQPVGAYSGTLTLPGRAPLTLDRVLGVTEDQDVLW